jgi:transcription elongation factor Elf1
MSSKYGELITKNKVRKCPECSSSKVGTVLDNKTNEEGWCCGDCGHIWDLELRSNNEV